MSQAIDLTGKRFNRLLVLRRDLSYTRTAWVCKCDCGNKKTVLRHNLIDERGTKSCGCHKNDLNKTRNITHGMSGTSEYHIWSGMIQRCSQPHPNYGGRGIRVCSRWRNSFAAFYKDMGPRPLGKELDRRDNNGNYKKSNCRWVTRKVNQNNTRKNLPKITYLGFTKTLADWSAETGISYITLYTRIFLKGMSVESSFKGAKMSRTIMIYDQCGQEPIQFFILKGDYSHLNNVYINSTAKNQKKQDKLSALMYDKEGQKLLKPLSKFPSKTAAAGAVVIVAGFLP